LPSPTGNTGKTEYWLCPSVFWTQFQFSTHKRGKPVFLNWKFLLGEIKELGNSFNPSAHLWAGPQSSAPQKQESKVVEER
jgi:hypothetical protein